MDHERHEGGAGQAEAMAAELSRPQPEGGHIKEQLTKLAMVGGTTAVAAVQLMQTSASRPS